MRAITFILLALLSQTPNAEMDKAQIDYMLQCQGCHKADGVGLDETVPNFNKYLARFIAHPKGREFLVRVPGSANAPFSDQQLASVLNWIMTDLITETPDNFTPYTASEIAAYKSEPLIEVTAARDQVLLLTE